MTYQDVKNIAGELGWAIGERNVIQWGGVKY